MSLQSAFFVRGLVFADPKPRHPSGLRTVKLDADEVPHMRRNIVGKAVDIEHSDVYAGFIIGTHHNARNDILVDLIVDTRLAAGREARDGVVNGLLRGLSFRAHSLTNQTTGIRYTSHYPIEVSLVANGAVERSSILIWGDFVTGMRISKSGYSRVFRIPQFMESFEVDQKRPTTVGAADVDLKLFETYTKAKPLLDQLSDDPNSAAAILQLAQEGIDNRRKTFSSALMQGGLADFVAKTCSAEDQEQFNKEMLHLSSSAEPISVMFRVAASAVAAVNNYEAMLAKGEATISKVDAKQPATAAVATVTAASAGFPVMIAPPASEMRVAKNPSDAIMKGFEQNRLAMQQMLSNKRVHVDVPQSEIASRLAQAKVVIQ